MARVQIVTPALNESVLLPRYVAAFLALREELAPRTELRLLVVDDGSTDETLAILRRAAADHPESIGYVSFTGNAGHQAALIAGLVNAGAWPDAIVTMDSDLEHPFAVIPNLIERWQRTGAVVVHAIRRDARELGRSKRWASALFYRVAARLTGVPLRPGQADFKLWDGKTIRGVGGYLGHIGSLRVFGAWLPGHHEAVEYDQHVEPHRASRFTLRKNLDLAVVSIVRFSQLPLRAITGLGLLGLLFAFAYGVFVTVQYFRGDTVPGWSSTVITVMTMGCLQLLSIGILAGYLSRLVFARDLPLYVVREARLSPEEELVPAAEASRRAPPVPVA